MMTKEISADDQDIKRLINTNANAAVVALKRFGLQEKSCVVTGGTKGVGAAIVFELASLTGKVSNLHVRDVPIHRAHPCCDRIYSPRAVHVARLCYIIMQCHWYCRLLHAQGTHKSLNRL